MDDAGAGSRPTASPEAGDPATRPIVDHVTAGSAGLPPGSAPVAEDHGLPGGAPAEPPPAATRRRPLIERVGMAAIALIMALLFGIVAAAAVVGGEPFLAAMGALGCLMTIWVGGITLLRG